MWVTEDSRGRCSGFSRMPLASSHQHPWPNPLKMTTVVIQCSHGRRGHGNYRSIIQTLAIFTGYGKLSEVIFWFLMDSHHDQLLRLGLCTRAGRSGLQPWRTVAAEQRRLGRVAHVSNFCPAYPLGYPLSFPMLSRNIAIFRYSIHLFETHRNSTYMFLYSDLIGYEEMWGLTGRKHGDSRQYLYSGSFFITSCSSKIDIPTHQQATRIFHI